MLCIVIEFDTQRVLDPDKGSLFAVIAETVPLPSKGAFVGHEPPRMDWVGRPEQTNIRLNNSGMKGVEDLRDLWNQQKPFAIEEKLRPLFFQRLSDSIATWDMRDGKRDWTPSALAAIANIFLDDFMLFDVAKPTTDTSHLEIEKRTLNGKPYQTGGGRTVDADVIDVLMTWMVNRDRERLQGGATKATKPGTKNFPYFAEPNTELQTVAESIELWCTARKGVGADRTIRRQLASLDRQHQGGRHRRWTIARHRDGRRQANRRTSRCDRQRRALLSLQQYRRNSGLELHRHARGQAEGCRKFGRVAVAVSAQRPGFAGREDNRVNSVQDWTRKSQSAVLRSGND